MTNLLDKKFMAASLRFARRHRALSGTNPSVGTLLVKDGIVVGKGVTAKGGRPHAERMALDMAGNNARGAIAYVSLEPCAHHGATPPCAKALIEAGVTKVFTAWTDPDQRVDGRGHEMLRQAGVEVETGLLADLAASDLSGYLNRKQNNRPQVILKLAVSQDGKLGREGEEVSITGALAKNYVHRMRAEYDAILVGRATVESDNPELTCRLPGLESRSPQRFVLDTKASLSPKSKLAQSAKKAPTWLVSVASSLNAELDELGVRIFAAEAQNGQLALPEILEDMAARGISSLMVEGGAKTAKSFLNAGLVDEIALFTGKITIGDKGITSPISRTSPPSGFSLVRSLKLGNDSLDIYRKG